MSKPNVNIINITPTPGSFEVLRNQTFTFTIQSVFQVNLTHTFVVLDNLPAITAGIINTKFNVVIVSNGMGYDYSITPNYLFSDKDEFNLEINAADIFGTPAIPIYASYIVVDTRPPLITPLYPQDGYIDVPLDLTIHFLINQLASPNTGLNIYSLNTDINALPAIVNGVIQNSFNGIYSAINSPPNITGQIEVLLDYAGQYDANDIVTVNTSIAGIVLPIIEPSAIFLNQYGQIATDNLGIALPSFVVSAISKITETQYQLTIGSSAIGDGYISDGYSLQNSNQHKFIIISIIDHQRIVIETTFVNHNFKYSFITAQAYQVLTTPVFSGYFQGIYLVDNLGDGYHINATWHSARTTRPDYDLAYLIYYSTIRSDVFFEAPKLITQGRVLPPPETIGGADAQLFGYYAEIPMPVGTTYYFGVRATEYPHSVMPVVPADGYGPLSSGLKTIDGYSFEIPASQTLASTISGITMLIVPVDSTLGYARVGGYIIVGPEIMRYTSLTSTAFIVASTGRGLFGTIIQPIHNSGENVSLYYGNFDDNTVIAKNLVSWESPNDSHRTRPDLITTNFMLEDGYHSAFEPFDYCGYHQFRPDELFNDEQCNTYVGGEFNGQRGFSIFDRMLANEEALLEVTGEPTILLRRIWSGETCTCRTSRKDSAMVRSCSNCFGTGFKGGFIQYFNPRRDDQRVMVHYAPADEDIGMGAQAGWDQKFAPGTWTIAIPAIKDRDVLVRFNEYGEMDWIYVVSTVSRSKVMFGRYARQKLKLNRLDKTDVLYQFKILK